MPESGTRRGSRTVRLTHDMRLIALALTEIGRRQRAGVMPTSDGRYVYGPSDDQCIDHLRANYRLAATAASHRT